MDTTITTWPTEIQRAADPFWVTRIPRPTAADTSAHALEPRRQQWDESLVTYEKNAAREGAARAERERKARAERARVESEQQAKRETERAATEGMLHQRFIAAGGTEAEWTVEKADLLAEHRRRQIIEAETADGRARAAQAERYRSF